MSFCTRIMKILLPRKNIIFFDIAGTFSFSVVEKVGFIKKKRIFVKRASRQNFFKINGTGFTNC